MIPFDFIVTVLVFHWFADFKLQSHWMASNKSKCNKALGAHVLVYTAFMLWLGLIYFSYPIAILFALINGAIHFGVDYCTSRLTSFRWKQQRWHDFFEWIGADQACHYFTIFSTYLLLK